MKRTRRQAFGQHFLKDQSAIHKILRAVELDVLKFHPKFLMELGPGHLALTEGLVDLCKKYDLKLILVERDRKLEHYIVEHLKEMKFSYELFFFDGATDELPKLWHEFSVIKNLGSGIFVSNLPYSASSQIIANLCEFINRLHSCIVMVQKELAERMYAQAGSRDRGSFSVLIESHFTCEKLFHVPPGAFLPPPQVMSTVLRLVPKENLKLLEILTRLADPLAFQKFCKQLFSGKRKMIRNLVPELSLSDFSEYGLKGTERPEELNLENLLSLFSGSVDRASEGTNNGESDTTLK